MRSTRGPKHRTQESPRDSKKEYHHDPSLSILEGVLALDLWMFLIFWGQHVPIFDQGRPEVTSWL